LGRTGTRSYCCGIRTSRVELLRRFYPEFRPDCSAGLRPSWKILSKDCDSAPISQPGLVLLGCNVKQMRRPVARLPKPLHRDGFIIDRSSRMRVSSMIESPVQADTGTNRAVVSGWLEPSTQGSVLHSRTWTFSGYANRQKSPVWNRCSTHRSRYLG